MQRGKERYSLRYARAGDVDRISEIERISFACPWSKRLIREAIQYHPLNYFVVAEADNDGILGYIGFSLVEDEIHIVTLATDPEARRRGIARALILDCLAKGKSKGASTVYLEVRESNAVAVRLYEGMGFRKVGRRRGYYAKPKEDALLYSLDLASAPIRTPDNST